MTPTLARPATSYITPDMIVTPRTALKTLCLAPLALLAVAFAPAIPTADKAGQRVEVSDVDLDAVPQIKPIIKDDGGPQFLLSDKPEYFRTGDGIAMRERVEPGDVRLYLYHVPTPDAGPKQITAVIENLGDEPLHVRFDKAVLPQPGGDYHKIGKDGQIGLLGDDDPQAARLNLTLAPGQAKQLDPRLGEFELKTNDLIHGVYEFTIDQPARVSVLQVGPDADPVATMKGLPLLPQVLPGHHASGAGRGLYSTSHKTVTIADPYDTAAGPKQVVFADGENEDWMTGRDSISGDETPNKGHYGVIYRVRIPYKSTDGRGVALMTYNPRAKAQWCGYQAVAMRVRTKGELPMPADGVVSLPEDQTRYGGPPEAVIVQRFAPAPDGGGVIEIDFTPPGASCLPVPLVLMPVDKADTGADSR